MRLSATDGLSSAPVGDGTKPIRKVIEGPPDARRGGASQSKARAAYWSDGP